MDSIVKEIRAKMQKSIDVLRGDFTTVRTGKASPTLVENITIAAYGGTQPLKVLELATVHVQDNSTLIIAPFDKSQTAEIEKGIAGAAVGLNPIVDGEILRISLPPLTEERRSEFVKLIKQKAESGKVILRQIRHEGMEEAKKIAKLEGHSEDEVERIEKEVQRATDEASERIDEVLAEKEKELMTL